MCLCQCQDSLFHFPYHYMENSKEQKEGVFLYMWNTSGLSFFLISLKKSQRKGQVISADFSSPKSMCEVQGATLEEVYGTGLNTCQVMYLTKYNRGFPNGRQPFMSKGGIFLNKVVQLLLLQNLLFLFLFSRKEFYWSLILFKLRTRDALV